VKVTVVVAVTAPVATLAGAEVEPAGITTVAGTGASDGLLLARPTVTPPAGAGPFSSGSTVSVLPPTSSPGSGSTPNRDGAGSGVTVMVTDLDEEPSVAVNVHGVAAVTLPAVNSTWAALFRPEPTVTEVGRGKNPRHAPVAQRGTPSRWRAARPACPRST
jgi:hypothetical protein